MITIDVSPGLRLLVDLVTRRITIERTGGRCIGLSDTEAGALLEALRLAALYLKNERA